MAKGATGKTEVGPIMDTGIGEVKGYECDRGQIEGKCLAVLMM